MNERLAEILLESLQITSLAEIEAAWNKEIEARISAYERGETDVFAAEGVFAEAQRITR
jgi:hypothetical protein